MIYFTSDTHFWHRNIIDFCNRPIGDTAGLSRDEICAKMNEVLINNWNSLVTDDDEIYHLGDFAFCGVNKAREIMERLNGTKYWILGNHDKGLSKRISNYFEWTKEYYLLKVRLLSKDNIEYTQSIVLCHYPIFSWDRMGQGSWHLHGHCHGTINRHNAGIKRYDVGVDPNNMLPISLLELQQKLSRMGIKPPEGDYHG